MAQVHCASTGSKTQIQLQNSMVSYFLLCVTVFDSDWLFQSAIEGKSCVKQLVKE